MLLIFSDKIADGAAGCMSRVAGGADAAGADASSASETAATGAEAEDRGPSMTIKRVQRDALMGPEGR